MTSPEENLTTLQKVSDFLHNCHWNISYYLDDEVALLQIVIKLPGEDRGVGCVDTVETEENRE